ncbi:hypothetical protein [Vagococcus fluvialis]|uniref:hypothetical protein n=1 Tax=Vagococcus fluvialis TaxID=2738 RepID=UPI001D0BC64E|nr:hypothetical protein [Vagococcus fluvialis]UDM72735.1 hypothetical protein K5L00_14350 [Vagococcus fluvialis]UDM78457.1 hypothetical protein K5K98_14555 [Vagococcus fluvialis]UDM84010.1 hypothetical protein K5K96_14375 [Vagococcus fluvialis]
MTRVISRGEMTIANISDGRDSYLHRAWSNSSDGGLDFTTKFVEDMRFIGTYVSDNEKQSNNPKDYDWTPLFDNVVVGGRNLFIRSTATEQFLNTNNIPGTGDEQNLLSDFIQVDESTSYIYQIWTKIDGKLLQNWSAWAFYDKDKKPIGARNSKYYNNTPKDSETYDSIVIKTPENAKYIRIGSRYLKNGKFKFEKGNVPTDWSPAPEDMATNDDFKDTSIKISKLEQDSTGFKQTVAEVTSKVDGMEIGSVNLISDSDKEWTGYSREFFTTFDLAPIFEKYGLDKTYSLSLDLKSKNTSKTNVIQVYMQNGSGTKYNFVNKTVSVTESYKRYKFESLKPLISKKDETRAILAFYGTYDTGNMPVVKNIKLEIGTKSTDWTPAIDDMATQNSLSESNKKISSLEQTANGFKQEVEQVKKDNQANKTQIEQTAKEVTSKVSSVEKKVDGIEIGATNLILDSTGRQIGLRGFSGEWSKTDNITVDEWKTKKAYGFKGKGSTEQIFATFDTNKGDPERVTKNGVSYVYSIYIKNNHEKNNIILSNNMGNNSWVKPKEIKRVVIYGTGNGTRLLQLNFMTDKAGDEIDFVYFKPMIAEGSVVSDWSPAPEDVLNEIDILRKDVEFKLTPDEIYGIVSSSSEYQDYMSDMATSEEFDEARSELDKIHDVMDGENGLVTRFGKFEQTTNEFGVTLGDIVQQVGSNNKEIEDMLHFMTFKRGDKPSDAFMSIGSSADSMEVRIGRGKISFFDGGVEVAYFSKQQLYIRKGIMTDSFQVGSHIFENKGNGSTVLTFSG